MLNLCIVYPSQLTRIASTLHTVYDEIMNSIITTAQDHVNLADALTSQVVEVLRSVGKKNEDSRKKVLSYRCRFWKFSQLKFVSCQEMQFFQKLLSDRDRIYAERSKVNMSPF
jgi:formin-binding protein 1